MGRSPISSASSTQLSTKHSMNGSNLLRSSEYFYDFTKVYVGSSILFVTFHVFIFRRLLQNRGEDDFKRLKVLRRCTNEVSLACI